MTRHPLKVSIIITCYNYARYVGQAIEGALAQTYPHVEVIVIDDGSTDGSDAVIGQYAGRIRSIRQVNQGMIAAFNRGYKESAGDLVQFLDADDLIGSTAVAECVAAWQGSGSKVQYDLSLVDAKGVRIARKLCQFTAGCDAAWARKRFMTTGTYRWPVTSGNLYARVYLEAMMPLSVLLAPDGLLNTVAPVYGDVITVPKALGSYRVHGANSWASNGEDAARLPERIAQRLTEIDELIAHARHQGVKLPPGNVLDHELTFISYRLTALRLGLDYDGDDADTPASLWRHGMNVLCQDTMPWHAKLGHAIWLSLISVAPQPLARSLIHLQFNRARYVRPLRNAARLARNLMGGHRQQET